MFRRAAGVFAAVFLAALVHGLPPGRDPSRADLNYDHPPAQSDGGLPIGSGRMGSLVWTDPASVRLQINRVDVFGIGGGSRSFPQRDTDYCGGCAAVRIDFGASVFPSDQTTMHLACDAGLATVAAPGVTVRALAWMADDVIALEVEDRRPSPGPVTLALAALRPAVVHTRHHTATSVLSTDADGTQLLTQSFDEDGYHCGSAVAGLAIAEPGGRTTLILIASAASFDPQARLAETALRRVAAARAAGGFASLAAANRTWWSAFWRRSAIHLHSADGVADRVEAGYTYFRYLMASSSRGAYPVKFNGMLWNTEGDARKWGAAYWGANQSCYYNDALLAADDADLMEPMFAMYTGMVPAEERAAQEEWGSRGIYFPETVTFDGLAPLPPAIAAEMPALYLLRKPWDERSQAFKDYARDMQPYTSRWNFMAGGKWVGERWEYGERGSGPFGPTSHILSRGAKIAYQYWERYEYTQDRAWLRDRAYPVLKGVFEFYRRFPNLTPGADGLWHIERVNSNEGLWGGRDTDEEIASMRALVPVLNRASTILGVDLGQIEVRNEFLRRLAPLPRSDLPGVYAPVPAPQPVWQRSFLPVVNGRGGGSLPDRNTLPVWFFDFCGLEAPDALRATANATFDAMTRGRASRFPSAAPGSTPRSAPVARRRGFGGGTGDLSKMPLAAAELGRADDVRRLIPEQMLQGEGRQLENRMDLREGAQTMGVERLGDAADALHTALCQDLPAGPGEAPVIRLFPAWPSEWDADFTLICRGNLRVSASQRGGVVGPVEIVARSGGECRVRNPWSRARLIRTGQVAVDTSDPLIVLNLREGERIRLAPIGK